MYMYTKQGHVHGIALYSYHTKKVPNQKLKSLDCPNMLIMDYNSLNLVVFHVCTSHDQPGEIQTKITKILALHLG